MKQNNWTKSCTQNEAENAWETLIWLESVTEKETGNAQPGACVDVLPRCSRSFTVISLPSRPISRSSLQPWMLKYAHAVFAIQWLGAWADLLLKLTNQRQAHWILIFKHEITKKVKRMLCCCSKLIKRTLHYLTWNLVVENFSEIELRTFVRIVL